MNPVQSTTRTPADFFFFGVSFLGNLIAAAGVVTTSAAAAIGGLILMAFAVVYFLITEV